MGKVKDAAIEDGYFDMLEREKEISNMNLLLNDEIFTTKQDILDGIKKVIKRYYDQLETEEKEDTRNHLNMEISLYARMYFKIVDYKLDDIKDEDYFYYFNNYNENKFLDCLELVKIHVNKLENNIYAETLYCEDDIDDEKSIVKVIY